MSGRSSPSSKSVDDWGSAASSPGQVRVDPNAARALGAYAMNNNASLHQKFSAQKQAHVVAEMVAPYSPVASNPSSTRSSPEDHRPRNLRENARTLSGLSRKGMSKALDGKAKKSPELIGRAKSFQNLFDRALSKRTMSMSTLPIKDHEEEEKKNSPREAWAENNGPAPPPLPPQPPIVQQKQSPPAGSTSPINKEAAGRALSNLFGKRLGLPEPSKEEGSASKPGSPKQKIARAASAPILVRRRSSKKRGRNSGESIEGNPRQPDVSKAPVSMSRSQHTLAALHKTALRSRNISGLRDKLARFKSSAKNQGVTFDAPKPSSVNVHVSPRPPLLNAWTKVIDEESKHEDEVPPPLPPRPISAPLAPAPTPAPAPLSRHQRGKTAASARAIPIDQDPVFKQIVNVLEKHSRSTNDILTQKLGNIEGIRDYIHRLRNLSSIKEEAHIVIENLYKAYFGSHSATVNIRSVQEKFLLLINYLIYEERGSTLKTNHFLNALVTKKKQISSSLNRSGTWRLKGGKRKTRRG